MGVIIKIFSFPFKVIDDLLGWFVFDMLFHKKRGFICLPLFVGAIAYVIYSWSSIGPKVWTTFYDGRDKAYTAVGWEIPSREPVTSASSTGATTGTTTVAPTPTTAPTAATAKPTKIVTLPTPSKKPEVPIVTKTATPTRVVTKKPTPPVTVVVRPTKKPRRPNICIPPVPIHLKQATDIVMKEWLKDSASEIGGRGLLEGTFPALGFARDKRTEFFKILEEQRQKGGKKASLAYIVLFREFKPLEKETLPETVALHALPAKRKKLLIDELIFKNREDTQLRALALMLPFPPPPLAEAPYFPKDKPESKPEGLFMPALGKLSRSAYPKVRERAAQWMGLLRSRSIIPFCKTLLKDPNGLVRLEAALALAAQGEGGGAEVVKNCLADASPIVRARAIRAIPQYSSAATKTNLQEWLIDGHPAVHLAAASTLLALDSHDGIWVLKDDLQDSDKRTKKIAMGALQNLPRGHVKEAARTLLKTKELHLETKLSVCKAVGRRGGYNSSGLAKALLRKKSAAIRLALLSEINPALIAYTKAAISKIALEDKEVKVRLAAMKALLKLRTNGPLETLVRAVQDESDKEVRLLAVRALGALKNSRALSPLSDVARVDKEQTIRCEAYRALGRLPGTVAKNFLQGQFKKLSPSSPEHYWTAVSLLSIETKDKAILLGLRQLADEYEL